VGYANRRVRERLDDVIAVRDEDDRARSVILRDMELSTIPFLNHLLYGAPWARRLDNLLVQGDLSLRLGSFIALMLLAASFGAYSVAFILERPLFALPAGIVAGCLPLFYAKRRKRVRVAQFERQLPDALDMLTNALRAGMAFPTAIQVVSEESPDPVAREFAIVFEENRLGLDMKEALRKLGGRIDSTELNLFVTAVILHRETGGNLTEILEGTATVIRDRFRILGDVRTLTAQSRMSGIILTVLPLVIAAVVLFLSPGYLIDFVADPVGRALVYMALVLQIVGFIAMRRIVNIKV
ncbi:MAG TPA: hypothetical protein ENO14_03320, partial [Chromatiales bacterium]|nr:hypothetical protein [Chromatiales bacterium]